ncbi:MAG: glucuronate isomerase, partial [Armatimonadota bacterium]
MSAAETDLMQSSEDLAATVAATVDETPIIDVHTHVYSAAFGPLLLWGVDELVTYHYLIAEVARGDPSVAPDAFYAMSRTQQADHIWQTLFLDGSPLSEAQRGVLQTLSALGIDMAS